MDPLVSYWRKIRAGSLINKPGDVLNMTTNHLIGLKVASLFTGAGGLDLGLINAGQNVIWANDNDMDSVLTYKKNIGAHIVESNIEDVDISAIPDHDLLVGGFPCQGFSRANINRIERDNRNSLYIYVVKILLKKQPPFFLLENVAGIKSLNGGDDFKNILKALEDSGYTVKHKILNAADYGVPQNRRRIILTGVRNDLNDGYEYRYPSPTHAKERTKDLEKWIPIGRALSGIPEPDALQGAKSPPNHIHSAYKVVPKDFTGHRLTDPEKPSPTILARGNAKGGVCAIPHPNGSRRLTVRESALVQTFPLDFTFDGKLGSMYRQVGNAVPVKLAELLGKGFFEVK